MRLSFFLVPMACLLIQTVGLANEKEPPVYCPSSNTYDSDEAHLMFEMPNNLDYAAVIQVANEMVQESADPDIHEIEVRQSSMYYAYKNLPILVSDTGKYKTFQFPEKELEFVVIRPIADCLIANIQEYAPLNHVYSRAFEKDALNVAVVRQLVEHDVLIHPLSKRGQEWLCTVNPQHVSCAN